MAQEKNKNKEKLGNMIIIIKWVLLLTVLPRI